MFRRKHLSSGGGFTRCGLDGGTVVDNHRDCTCLDCLKISLGAEMEMHRICRDNINHSSEKSNRLHRQNIALRATVRNLGKWLHEVAEVADDYSDQILDSLNEEADPDVKWAERIGLAYWLSPKKDPPAPSVTEK